MPDNLRRLALTATLVTATVLAGVALGSFTRRNAPVAHPVAETTRSVAEVVTSTPADAQPTRSGAPETSGTIQAGCCASNVRLAGIGVTGKQTEAVARTSGGLQRIRVDLSTGYYRPNVLRLKHGMPAEVTFGRSQGCSAVVQSTSPAFTADLSSGPKTVHLASLKPGTYTFTCSMYMIVGKIVVE